ncbi:MAG TPA: hemolysin, partial [Trueperaceae bacterium]|nr:hemolysin [Trueperaceae bacterium]
GTSSSDLAKALATDSVGNVYLAGSTYGYLFGASNNGVYDAFIVKYNSTGTEQWHKLLGTNYIDVAYALATDNTDNVYLAGFTTGDLFGETNYGNSDAFIAKY